MAEKNQNNQATEQDLSELLQIRRDKLSAMMEAGNNPFEKTKYDISAYSMEIKGDFDAFEGKEVSLGGRIISRRIMGKASFVGLRDGEGDIQLYVRRDDVG
jgi:lysyl-tRNA synthetase class 2